jgi:predicted transcriptional regulator
MKDNRKMYAVRLSSQDRQLLSEVAKSESATPHAIARNAIREYIYSAVQQQNPSH